MDNPKPEMSEYQEKPSYRPQPISGTKTGLSTQKKSRVWIKRTILALVGLVVLATIAVISWFIVNLSPVDTEDSSKKIVKIVRGSSPSVISAQLEKAGIIRSAFVFELYARIIGKQGLLQAGTYRLSPSQNTQTIVGALTAGDVDEFWITFLPGGTVADAKKVLIESGYSEAEVEEALSKEYDHQLLKHKPAGSDLEGYVWGDTYKFNSGETVENVLMHSFTTYLNTLRAINFTENAAKQGMNLHEAITLASIIQRESGGDDKPQISQVFHSRLAIGMPLGSDVTYQYVADKLGIPRSVDLDNPYNTRVYKGLPPGPIAAPGVDALKAAVEPADGDYLYFLSGDDDVTYFSRTFAEHDANRAAHCQQKCQIL